MKKFLYVLSVLYYEVQFFKNIFITTEVSRLVPNTTVN